MFLSVNAVRLEIVTPPTATEASSGAAAIARGDSASAADNATTAGVLAEPTLLLRVWRAWQLRFVALAMIWGLSFLFIKVGIESLTPIQVTFSRMAFGAAALGIALVIRRERLPRGWRVWGHLGVAAFLLNTVPFTLFGYAEQHITSALAGICNAGTPIFTLLVSLVILSDERPTRNRVVGLTVGFVGVLVVLGVWRGVSGDLGGTLMALGAALCYGIGLPYLRRFLSGTGYTPVELSTGQLLFGTAQIAVLLPFAPLPTSLSPSVVAAMALLGIFGTGLAYIFMNQLLREAGATVAATVTYLVPIVATVAGVAVLGEQLAWYQPVGALIIIAGAALSQGVIAVRRRPTRE